MVKQLCFDVNDCAEVRELLRQSNGNITNDKIDEIIACLASPQGITCFYYSSAQGYQSRLQHTSQDVRELLSKSLCSRYFTTGRVDEQNSKIDKVTFTFFGAATTADL